MTRTEDRLADALGASARTVREDLLRPPVLPPHRDRRWARWLAPAAAAAAVALVAVLVAALTGQAPAHSPSATGTPGPPRYYAVVGLKGQPQVRSTATGAVTATVPVHVVPNGGDGTITASANGTFFLAVATSQSHQQIYQFRLTATGQVSGFSAVPGGLFSDLAGAMAASRDGSRLAVATSDSAFSANKIVVIDVRTGAHSVWQGGLARRGFVGAEISSLSWTAGQQLVFAWQRCYPMAVNDQTCEAASHGGRRAAGVREISTASPGGRLDSGRVLLRQSARYPYIASALISPDGQTITALVMHGSLEHQAPGTVPRQLSVVQISAATGRQVRVLYQRPLGPTFYWTLSPDGPGTHWLLDGADSYGGGDGPRNLSKLGYNGWISGGKLIPLQPATGFIAGEAW